MPDVFISYNREDREVAREVAAGLEAEGFSVWYDAALRAGEYYEEVTESNLRSAGAVVVLWSKRSASSKWVRAEATVGERSSTLVPALIEECDRPVRFELLQTADLTRWHGDRNDPNWRGFVGDVRAAISRRGHTPAQKETPARPGAPAAAAAQAPRADAVNIETTFWNSIKDGSERADFEAYLSRYPKGHFADLARNRIAVLDRATPGRPASPLRQPPPA
ncbi:MAG: toll/interleukin-1 receptor domain-containing protein, partial [Parvularculaceae bacterium]|nr:toll/interleukin-1 receptor domain-containing protein [Parvularculaceae bacterium]